MNLTANGRQNMKKRITSILLAIFFTALVSSCGGGGGSSVGGGASAPAASLVSIEVTPADPVIALGTTTQLKATGIYSDSTRQDLTASVTWRSSDDTVATVSRGLAKSMARGSATIDASSKGITGSRTLTVTDATLVAIQITPANPSAALGTTKQLTATGTFSDDSTQDLTRQVAWSASDAAVASVDNAAGDRGLASADGIGATVVCATLDGVTGTTDFTVTPAVLVSIQVTPANAAIAKGTTRQLAATGLYTDHTTQDLTTQVIWGTTDASVASVGNAAGSNGLASAVGVGRISVSASLGGVTGTTNLDVTAAALVSIDVTPTNPALAKGTKRQLTATGLYTDHTTQDLTTQVTWGAADASVASVSNAAGSNGLASALGVGRTSVSATLGTVTGTTNLDVTAATLVSIDVTPAGSSLAKGTKGQLSATGAYTDGATQDLTTQVTWGTTDASVASVSNAAGSKGLASALGVGSTSVSASLGGVTGTTTLAVTAAVLAAIQVEPADAVTAMDVVVEFSATGIYSDGATQDLTTQVTWGSSDTRIAAISNADEDRGTATPAGCGTTKITATLDGVWGGTTLTVSKATLVGIVVTPADRTIGSGKTLQYTATAYYSDGMTLDVTRSAVWKSSDNKVAKVSNARKQRGYTEGGEPGTASISAKLGGKLSGSTTLTVK